jgi:phosphohistidine phosphatase
MDLFLVRHGIAEESAGSDGDARRALTEEGRKRLRREVEGLERLGVRFDRVLHSPLLRAQETAELLEPVCDGEMEVARELADVPSTELFDRVRATTFEKVALVGHEPWLSELLAWLVLGRDGNDGRARGGFDVQKGGVVHVTGTVQPGAMKLVAFYPPSALRKLARR